MKALRATDGSRWAFMRRYDIADLLDPTDTYLTRWRVVQTPWFGIYLHKILRPDADRHLHDHPWPFVSVVLRGGYDEEHVRALDNAVVNARAMVEWPGRFVAGIDRRWRALSVHAMRRGQYHSIRTLCRTPTWTLVFVGRRTTEWGYATDGGWVHHDAYHEYRRAEAAS